MAHLRIKKFLSDRGITETDLSQLTRIPENTLNRYAQESIDINEDTVKDIRKIASQLNIPPAKLIQPVRKQSGIRLKIIEVLENSQDSKLNFKKLSELCERLQVHPSILVLYSTQVMLKEKWEEEQTQKDISSIASILGVSIEELAVIEDPPITKIRLDDFLKEKGLTIEQFSLLNDFPVTTTKFLASQPIDLLAFKRFSQYQQVIGTCCKYIGCWLCKECCS